MVPKFVSIPNFALNYRYRLIIFLSAFKVNAIINIERFNKAKIDAPKFQLNKSEFYKFSDMPTSMDVKNGVIKSGVARFHCVASSYKNSTHSVNCNIF